MNKACKAVMLPAQKSRQIGSIVQRPSDGRLATINVLTVDDPQECINQHLYIISNDKIKEGWILGLDDKPHYVKEEGTYRVIIATTDESFGLDKYEKQIVERWGNSKNKFPSPSKEFVEKYVNEYNKGNAITDVLVEYYKEDSEIGKKQRDLHQSSMPYEFMIDKVEKLKTNQKGNCIIIHPSKKYSREEVMILTESAFAEGVNAGVLMKELPTPRTRYAEWVKDNL